MGTSGSGKTTLATELARRLDLPHTELDALHWGPNWTPRPIEDFLSDVKAVTSSDAWVIDGNYSGRGAAELIRERADSLVWVDPPRATVMWRVVTRSVRRIVKVEQLWNGNGERWSSLFGRESLVCWAWTSYARNRARYTAAQSDPTFAHLTCYRLKNGRERDAFLASL